MFKLASAATFTRQVTVSIPDGDGVREETMSATFQIADEDQFDTDTIKGTIGFLRATIVRLDDIADADGHALSYDDSLRDQILKLPYVRAALLQSYFRESTGARLGN